MNKRVYNPPFPHKCRIIRKIRTGAMIDEPAVEGFNDDEVYDPFADDSDGRSDKGDDTENTDITDTETDNGDLGETDVNDLPDGVTLVYDGACMAYPEHTTSSTGKVITSLRGIAVPITESGWEELGVEPRKNDEVYIWRGMLREYGLVTDVNAANFGGSEILVEVNGN